MTRRKESNRRYIMLRNSVIFIFIALFISLALIIGCVSTQTVKKDVIEEKPETKEDECKKHFNIGFEYQKMSMWEDARINFEKAITCSSTYVDAYLGLGKVYDKMQQYGLEEETYNTLIEKVPDTVKGYIGLGSLYAKLGRYDEAVNAYNKAMKIDSLDAAVYHGLGHVYEKQKDYEKARKFYEIAHKLDPDNRAIAYALGKIYLELKKSEKAITLLEKIAEEFPKDIDVRLTLGDACLDCKKYSKALEHYKIIEDDLSEFGTIYVKIAKSYDGLCEYSKAAKNYITAVEKSDNKIVPYYHLITMYLRIKNFGAAQKYITQAFTIAPNDPALNCMKGDVYVGYGDSARNRKKYKAAISHYKTAKTWYGKARGDVQWGTYAKNGIKRADAKIKNTQQKLWYGD